MNKVCAVCGGSGQISFFQGVSRFLLTTEECPECAGTGYPLDPDNDLEFKKQIHIEQDDPEREDGSE